MFTGIVEHLGHVTAVHEREGGRRIVIDLGALADGLAVGASIAVNGVCLTAVECARSRVSFDVIPESLARSNLGELVEGSPVNLERALIAGARLDGHFVQGHVDATGVVATIETLPGETRLTVTPPAEFLRLCVPKGSVAIDGVSLTIAALGRSDFTVALIPHTLAVTTLGSRAVGNTVNLEADMIGKYVQRLLEPYQDAATAE